MQLSNGLIALEFDDRNGCLRSLRDLSTGVEHLPDARAATLFRLLVPTETWQSCYVDAQAQTCTLKCHGDRVTLRYGPLVAADGATLPIQVEILVDLLPGQREALWQMMIANDSARPISEVCFPKLGGWTGYAGPGADTLTPGCPGITPPPDPHAPVIGTTWSTFMRVHRRWATRFPLGTFLPWFDLSGGGHGLWLINYMQCPYVGGFVVENERGYQPGTSLSLGWFANPEILPGKRWESQRFGLGLHAGDWHATARHYRDWLQSWWRPALPPERLRRALAIQNVAFTHFDGAPIRPLSQIPAIAARGLQYGVRDLCVWDYLMLGTYGRVNGAGLTAYPPEQWETLRRGLAEARGLGCSVSMLLNHRLVSQSSDFWRAGGERGALRVRDGSLRIEPAPCSVFAAEATPHWMGPQAAVLCQRSDEFRQAVNAELDRLLEVGFDAFFLDQPFEYLPCYAPNHHHLSPDDTHTAISEWIGEFRWRLRERYPEGYLIGEMPDLFVGQAVDVWWNWYWPVSRPEIMAYSAPALLNSYVTDTDVERAQRGFLHGFLLMLTTHGLEGTLDDVPQFAAYIRALAKLRERTAPWTTQSAFADVDDLACEGVEAKHFSGPTGAHGVVAINPNDYPTRARLRLGGLDASYAGQLYRLDGATIETGSATGDTATLELVLAPHDVVVWALTQAAQ